MRLKIGYVIVALFLVLASILINPAPAQAAYDLSTVLQYFDITYTASFSNLQIYGNQPFSMTINATATCKKNLDFPLNLISSVKFSGHVIGRNNSTQATVELNPGYTLQIASFPKNQGDTYSDSKSMTLQFPAGSQDGSYTIIGEPGTGGGAWVQILFIWYDVTSYLPSGHEFTTVSYAASAPVQNGGGGGGYSPPTLPVVTTVTPVSGAIGVAVNPALKAVFSMAMNPASLTTSTFTLMNGSTAVAGTVIYDSTTNAATFTPSGILSYSTAYTATITTGVRSISGYGTAGNFVWTFTTAAAPPPITTTPAVTTTPPVTTTAAAIIPSSTSQPLITDPTGASPAATAFIPPATPAPSSPAPVILSPSPGIGPEPAAGNNPSTTPAQPPGGPSAKASNSWWLLGAIIALAAIVGIVLGILLVRRKPVTK